MMLRRRDVEQWMSHRLLPEDIRKSVQLCISFELVFLVIHFRLCNGTVDRTNSVVCSKKCRRVREAERFNWAATRGVNEELLFENMPEDLRRDIKRHLFKFLKKVISIIHCTRTESISFCILFR